MVAVAGATYSENGRAAACGPMAWLAVLSFADHQIGNSSKAMVPTNRHLTTPEGGALNDAPQPLLLD